MISILPLLFELPGWLKDVLELWPIFIAIGAMAAAAILGLIWLFAGSKKEIHNTHSENVKALKELLGTRDLELAEARECLKEGREEREALEGQNATLASELRVVSSIVVEDVILWAGRQTEHAAELNDAKTQNKLLKMENELLEKRLLSNGKK